MSAASPVRASAIIVSYNSRSHLENGLGGILASLGEMDELILVDNGSVDGSPEYVRQVYPKVKVVALGTNLGFGSANNRGVEQAAGEYVTFINPDTTVEGGWLDSLLQALQTDPGIGLVTSRLVLMSAPDTINTCGNDVHISGITLCRGMGHARKEYETQAPVGAVSGASFAMRRRLFQKLGGYDADFFLYMEDTDLSLRARLAGARSVFVPGSIVRHAYELRFGASKTYYQERNRYVMLLKLYRWGSLLVLLPVFLLGEVVTWGYALLFERQRLGNKWRAYGWVIRNWKQIMVKRRQVQQLRRVPDRVLIAEMPSRLEISQVEQGWVGKAASAVFSALFAVLKLWARCWVWW